MGLGGKYKRIRITKGQSTLEFAMIVPFIIIIVLAVFPGRPYRIQQDGASAVSTGGSQDNIHYRQQ